MLLAAVLSSAIAALIVPVGSAETPTIEAIGGGYNGYGWSPSTAEVVAGGAVAFKNASATVPHGVSWKSGPEAPGCSGVPIDGEKTSWSGSCTFAQVGTYAFVCPVHPTEMKGTVTVAAAGTDNPPPPPGQAPESPLDGPASQALKVSKAQRGRSVRGSIDIAQAGAGGKLEVVLLARRALVLGPGHTGTMRVGRLVAGPLSAGRRSFSVALRRAARQALRSRDRLPVTVRIVVTPARGSAVTLKRGVVIHV
jgi:plastocyanin